MTRQDGVAEVIRRNNAVARANSKRIIFAGLSQDSMIALAGHLPAKLITHVSVQGDIDAMRAESPSTQKTMVWGNDYIGIGLLKALREKAYIQFEDVPSTPEIVPSKSGHWVVCEAGEELSEVIAANYAFALGAGLIVIPNPQKQESDALIETFYSLYDRNENESQTQRLERLKARLRELCGTFQPREGDSITFVTKDLPYGFGFPEVPCTHLFKYPDLGIAIINGFAAEQPYTRGSNIAVFVDPETTDAPEVAVAAKMLAKRRAFVRGYQGRGANVTAVADMVELFPYDLLFFATHCGDAPGHRWTYEYRDSEGLDRTLVVDIAIGVGRTDDPDMLQVVEFTRFHSLDGVDWNDTDKKAQLHVGTAIHDYIEATRGDEKLLPIKKETVSRVHGSAALRMSDNNYIPVLQSIANKHSPIIFNNACVSWHELASRFFFAGARGYIGTLFQVGTSEAHDVTIGLLGKHFGKPLAHALWATQNIVYCGGIRRPYIVSGVYPQKLRITQEDVPRYILQQLVTALADWRRRLRDVTPDSFLSKRITEVVKYYAREAKAFAQKWRLTS